MRPLKACRMKCNESLPDEDRGKCFQNYWNLGSRNRRANYIASLININPKKTEKLGPRKKYRECSYKYSIIIDGIQKPICKTCLIATLGETKGFIEIVGEKKKNALSGIISPDRRGIAPSGNKRSAEEIQNAKDHILSFPKYESHYFRNRTSKKYLSSDLSIAKMYDMYKQTVDKPVSLTLYKNCFYSLNLAFKKPKQDTCSKCDIFETKLKVLEEGEEKENLRQERDKHHQLADDAYKAKQVDKEVASSDTKKRAYTFDLQQCLPTPFLTANTVFYKRQLWTFNLTVHDLATNEVTCFMWDESTAGRGGNQIASCIYRLLLELNDVEEVTFYSDTCGGQNKNQQVAFMFTFAFTKLPNLKIINHKFLVSGHTHMECDTDREVIIEKNKKRTQMKINHPNDWYQMVRSCKRKKPFKVVVMTQKDFLDFSSLGKEALIVKKVNTDGEKFLWQPVQWFQYNNQIGILKYKHGLDVSNPFKSVNFRRRGKRVVPSTLPQITDKLLPISKEKKKDLLDLLPLIDEVFHNFYRNLPTTDMQDLDPDLEEFDADNQ
ncbi:uncharacterized protein LOC126889549 [Diabrotica virgifera virgifera]|uniref:Uncharacterized protein n=1 Tax=Diabrotica virgifera virgifera TaxID=50390 RepID=A0ABM5KUK8_DIAVI|nr:uncharacterized protein LOC126889549 [Diabrotica virgifera virgifera]